ncbi:MAG: Riboflavin transporter [Holosporales bacterium]
MTNHTKAFLYMFLWAVFFLSAMSFNKLIDKSIPTAVIVFYRVGFAALALLPTILYNRKTIFKTNQLGAHIGRAVLVSFVTWCTYYAYRHLPLDIATSIGLSGPLFTTLFAALFLKEHLTLRKTMVLIIGYIGVLIVVFPHCQDVNSLSTQAVFVAIIGNIIMGGIIVLLKYLTRTDETQTILTYNTLLVAVFYALFAYPDLYIPEKTTLLQLFAIGILGLSLQFFYARALSLADASFVSLLEYLRILLSIPLGYFIFHETIQMNTLIGAVLIIVALVKNHQKK